MDAIIPPNNTQLLTTEHHKREHRCSTPEQVQIEGMEGRLNTDVNGAEDRLTTNTNGAEARLVTNTNAAEGRLVTNTNGAEARGVAERQGLETRLNVDGRLDSIRETFERSFDKTQDGVEKFGFANLDVTDKFGWRNLDETDKHGWRNQQETRFYGHENFKAVKDGIKDLAMQQCEDTHKILSNADCHYAAIQLEAAKNHGVAQTKLIETKYQLELEAQKTAALLAAQIAECCCENKLLVTSTACETQELIRKLDENRVRDQLARTHEELVALRLRASLLPPLVPAVAV